MAKGRDITETGGTGVARSAKSDVASFLDAAKRTRPVAQAAGRIVFALDATASRQPTWDRARDLQAGMFEEAGKVGGLAVQLVYFRGMGECRSSRWVTDTQALSRSMSAIQCSAGLTQIGKVLAHTLKQAKGDGVSAAVLIGDASEENIDVLAGRAGQLRLLNAPVFAFLEGADRDAEAAYRTIAKLSGGVFARFDTGSAARLRDLLASVARYAAGGRAALTSGKRADRLLLEQMKR